jgi:hypothetical protein
MAQLLYVDLLGEDALRAALAKAVSQVRDPHAMLEGISGVLEMRINARFDSKTDPQGQAWAPLAPRTLKRYAREDTPKTGPNAGTVVKRGTLLERTGQMRASLFSQVVDDALEIGMSRRTDGGKTGPLDGGNWSIPLLHEYSTARMPRRGIFTADPEAGVLADGDRDAVLAEVTGWLEGLFD